LAQFLGRTLVEIPDRIGRNVQRSVESASVSTSSSIGFVAVDHPGSASWRWGQLHSVFASGLVLRPLDVEERPPFIWGHKTSRPLDHRQINLASCADAAVIIDVVVLVAIDFSLPARLETPVARAGIGLAGKQVGLSTQVAHAGERVLGYLHDLTSRFDSSHDVAEEYRLSFIR
jgi:hypothetical protein